jgi:hypothetical protein
MSEPQTVRKRIEDLRISHFGNDLIAEGVSWAEKNICDAIGDHHIIPGANAVVMKEGLENAEGALRAVCAEKLEELLGRIQQNKSISAAELGVFVDEWLTAFFDAAPRAVLEAAGIACS